MKRNLIGLLVVLHFAFGLCAFLPTPSAPRSWPVIGTVIDLYQVLDLQQTWKMFSPPAQDVQEVAASFKLHGGWTRLTGINERLKADVKGRWLAPLPRGFIRLSNHFRPPQLLKPSLDDEPDIKFYYRELSAYFCDGQGRLDGLEAVRFYVVTRGIEPFYPADENGKPLPTAAERSSTRALYERECGQT